MLLFTFKLYIKLPNTFTCRHCHSWSHSLFSLASNFSVGTLFLHPSGQTHLHHSLSVSRPHIEYCPAPSYSEGALSDCLPTTWTEAMWKWTYHTQTCSSEQWYRGLLGWSICVSWIFLSSWLWEPFDTQMCSFQSCQFVSMPLG